MKTNQMNVKEAGVTGCAISTVMIVEDDADLREGLAYLIYRQGYGVVTAGNGQEALASLEGLDPPPCLIILDLMMPEMNGWELRDRLLSSPRLKDVPVLLVSGVADLETEASGLKAVDFLNKPVDFDRLYELIGEYC